MVIRITPIPLEWKQAARREGLTVAQWLKAACDYALARGSTR